VRRAGAFSGYTEFRYGPTKTRPYLAKPRHRRIFEGPEFEAIVSRTAGALAGARWSKFQYEAACRHGLRQGLVLAGHRWGQADLEAARIVAAALSTIGARRPSWEQGQREYAIGPDRCANCGGPMDAAGLISGKRFCSPECARARYAQFDRIAILENGLAEQTARYFFKRELNPDRPCERCRRVFRPAVDGARYCSALCARLARGDLVPDRQCDHCGKTYHPPTKKAASRYCSAECKHAAERKILPRACSVCGKEFTPKRDAQTACSRDCSRREPGKLPEKPCECCGAPFRPKTPWGKFCSPTCRNLTNHRLEAARARERGEHDKALCQ
jgi:hypothetical protein